MYTLSQLRNKAKRRIRQYRSTTSVSTETEAGNIASNSTIEDAINRGRKQLMLDVKNTSLWGAAKWVFATALNTEVYKFAKDEEHVLSVNAVYYDVDSDGDFQDGTTYEAHEMESEEFARNDPMNTPSATNPLYRFTNAGLKLMVSTDGSMTASKNIKVEGIRELSDLTQATDNSDISDTLDELCLDYAIFIICQHLMPDLAMSSLKTYYQNVAKMNKEFRGI